MEKVKRRPKGASPRGNFEESKAYAVAEIEDKRNADKRKTEALRALRLGKGETGEPRKPK
jgi:hypothetical protein